MILCENGPDAAPVLFDGAEQTHVVWQARDLQPTLALLDRARAAGAWIAGYVAYEAGYAIEPRLAPLLPKSREEPLLAFGIYHSPQDAGLAMARARAKHVMWSWVNLPRRSPAPIMTRLLTK